MPTEKSVNAAASAASARMGTYAESDMVPVCLILPVGWWSIRDYFLRYGRCDPGGSDRRNGPGHRVDDPVHGVTAPLVGQVAQQLEHEPHQRRVGHAVPGREPHDLRSPDQLHEPPAQSVVPTEAGAQLTGVE